MDKKTEAQGLVQKDLRLVESRLSTRAEPKFPDFQLWRSCQYISVPQSTAQRPAASESPGNLFKKQILGPHSDLLSHKLLGWDLLCILTSLPGDSDTPLKSIMLPTGNTFCLQLHSDWYFHQCIVQSNILEYSVPVSYRNTGKFVSWCGLISESIKH